MTPAERDDGPPSVDRAARHLARLLTRADGWHTKPEHKRDEYRTQVRELFRLAGAELPDDRPPAPTVDAAAVAARLDTLGGMLGELIARQRATEQDTETVVDASNRPVATYSTSGGNGATSPGD